MEDEIEVETSLVFSKVIKIRMITGATFTGEVKVYECDKPYAMIIMIDCDTYETIRTDVFKKDLAEELKACLEGKVVRNPVALVSVRIEEAIMKFIKFGKTPKQEDLIMWILSRSELYPPLNAMDEIAPVLFFGGKPEEPEDHAVPDLEDVERQQQNLKNNYTKTSTIASAKFAQDDYPYLIHSQKNNTKQTTTEEIADRIRSNSTGRLGQSARLGTSARQYDDLGTYAMTKKLLGKSATLETLKQTHLKGRKDAKAVASTMNWTNEHWRLCKEIEKARNAIEEKMETRRKMIEVSKARQVQKADRLSKIRTELAAEQGDNQFIKQAIAELATLQKIEESIESNILQQKAHIHRDAQLVFWTMAPSGFQNRRGKSQRGPVLGDGPLPPNATSALQNPDIMRTMRYYYWDMAGRRHTKDPNLVRTEQEESLIEQAMNAIKKASQNLTLYRLNLMSIFQQFDVNGDGYLSASEMCEAFLQMGIKLDIPSAKAIFDYFDRNGSGSVHYGEFVWAFFNRRQLISQWKQKTTHLTMAQIQNMFHLADINGNGRLNYQEFAKLLTKSFGLILSKEELEILIQHFDVDSDGEIDLYEFIDFMESEQHTFGSGSNNKKNGNSSTSPASSKERKTNHSPSSPSPSPSTRSMKTNKTTTTANNATAISSNSSKSKTKPLSASTTSGKVPRPPVTSNSTTADLSASNSNSKPVKKLVRKHSLHATAPGNIEVSAIKQHKNSKSSPFHTITLAYDDVSTECVDECDQALRMRQQKSQQRRLLANTTPARLVTKKLTLSPSSTTNKGRSRVHQQQHSDEERPEDEEEGSPDQHNVSVSSLPPGYEDLATASVNSHKSNISHKSNKSNSGIIGGSEGGLHESVDVMWMAKMLQTQADVESRLGRKYYKNV